MNVCIICTAQWEIPFEFFSFRNYFEAFTYHFIFWSHSRARWWTRQKRWGWGKRPFPFFLPWLWLLSFLFCWNGLLPLGLTKSNFFSFSLTCFIYLAYLLKKFLDFLILSLLAHQMSYLQLYCFFLPAPSLQLTTGENICIMLTCMRSLSISYLLYWIYVIT